MMNRRTGIPIRPPALTTERTTRPLGYPMPSSSAASNVMQGNRSRDSQPELQLRSALHQRGLRFRKHQPIRLPQLLVRPDIVFTRCRLAIFVDGCFWHGCPDHGTQPRVNTDYWKAKLARNRDRDLLVSRVLAEHGWLVLRFWEHERVDEVADYVAILLSPQPLGRSSPNA